MAIKNINTIQNPNDLDYLAGVTQEYLVQALANLGQRIGVKGDSILTDNFLFSSLVDGESYDVNKFVGFVKNVDDTYVMGICERTNVNNIRYSYIVQNTSDYIITSEVCKLNKVINNIDGYDTNGRICVTHNFYTFGFTGIQYVNNKIKYEEYICERVNKFNNKLDAGVRFRRFGTLNTLKMVYLFVDPDTSKENVYQAKVYTAINNDTSITDITNIINNVFTNPETLTPEQIVNTQDIINLFNTSAGEVDVYTNVVFNENSLSFEFDETETIGGRDYTAQTLKQVINYFSYDIHYLYRFTKNYFSELVFKYDNEQLRRQIVVQLHNLIISENNLASNIIYIPLNYTFNYAYNSGNPAYIYYNTLDICTKYVNGLQLPSIVMSMDNSAWICETSKCERVSMFNYSVNYDPEESTVIYGINAYKHYTLPYINGENYWVLNDIDSNLYAKGINAGNPNIVLIRTRANQTKPDIISAASYTGIFNKLSWKKESVLVRRIDYVNVDAETSNNEARFIVINCCVPDLSNIDTNVYDEYKVALENAMIINMSVVDNVVFNDATKTQYKYTKEEIINEYGADGVITTLWHFNADTLTFEFLKEKNNISSDVTYYALDFNYITNSNHQINYAIRNHEQKHPDKFLHDKLIFSNAYVNLKNQSIELNSYAYPTLINKESSKYSEYNYINNLNFSLQYNDTVYNVPSDITYAYHSANRYYNYSIHDGNHEDSVTNALYSYILDNNYVGLYNDFIPNYDVPTVDQGEVFLRNQTVLNRVNILTFDKNGKAYNAYIGTSYDVSDKSKLIIGSSVTNVNIGEETLINKQGKSSFAAQNEIELNFNTTYISKNAEVGNDLTVSRNIITNGVNWTKHVNTHTNIIYWDCEYIPNSRYIYEKNSYLSSYTGIVKLNNINIEPHPSYISYLSNYSTLNYCINENKMLVITTVPEQFGNIGEADIYLGDSIYIPALLYNLHLDEFIKKTNTDCIALPNVFIESNMDVISYTNQIGETTPLLLKTTSRRLYDNQLYYYIYNYNVDTEGNKLSINQLKDFTYTNFSTNPLQISYYIANNGDYNQLNVSIHEIKTNNIIPYIYKLETNYTL